MTHQIKCCDAPAVLCLFQATANTKNISNTCKLKTGIKHTCSRTSAVTLIKHKLISLPLSRLVRQTKSTAACTHMKLRECGLGYNYPWQFSESVLQVCESFAAHKRNCKQENTVPMFNGWMSFNVPSSQQWAWLSQTKSTMHTVS